MTCVDSARGWSVCAWLVLLAVLSAHASPNGGRNALMVCRDRSTSCGNMQAGDCYVEEENFRCCRTCWNLSRQLSRGPGCLYGDKDAEVCRFVRARHCAGQYYRNICCATCESFMDSLKD